MGEITTTTELLNSLAAKLQELDAALELVNEINQSFIEANLPQLAARVSTLESKTTETNADVQVLQSLFNTDHYETIPALVTNNSVKDLQIAILNERVNQINAFIEALKALN